MADPFQQRFQELVDEHYQNLYRFAYSLSKNQADASDLVQQTFTIYAQKADTLRDPSKAKSWLFTTLYHEFLRHKKHGNRQSPQEHGILETHMPPQQPQIDTWLDSKTVVDALDNVDEIYRAPLTLFYLRSLSYKEIAAFLNIPIGTVMSRISRGKMILKNALFPSEPAQPEDSCAWNLTK